MRFFAQVGLVSHIPFVCKQRTSRDVDDTQCTRDLGKVRGSFLLRSAAQRSAAQRSAAQRSTAQHSHSTATAQHNVF
jgi:hypothetical protein